MDDIAILTLFTVTWGWITFSWKLWCPNGRCCEICYDKLNKNKEEINTIEAKQTFAVVYVLPERLNPTLADVT